MMALSVVARCNAVNTTHARSTSMSEMRTVARTPQDVVNTAVVCWVITKGSGR